MELSLLVAVIVVVIALLRGGSLERLASTNFRWPALLFVGLVLQLGFDLWDPDFLTEAGGLAVLIVSQVLVATFLALNWDLPGMRIAAVGLGLNVIAIGLNGAMPVSETAARMAGLDISSIGAKHEVLGSQTVVPFLTDIIPVPIIHKVVSIGDVVLAIGLSRFAYQSAMKTETSEAAEDRAAVV